MTFSPLGFIHVQIHFHQQKIFNSGYETSYSYINNKNPKLGEHCLHYYYHTMARALAVYGDDIVTDEKNVDHNWREEFFSKLVSLQNSDGCWINRVGRWWENSKDHVTSYSILALEQTLTWEQ